MSICIWGGMKSAGEHPVGGEKVSVLCPEPVEKEDARRSAVVYYTVCIYIYIYALCTGDYFSFPLTKCRVISQWAVCRILIFFPNCIFSKRISWVKRERPCCIRACFYNPNLQSLYIEVKPLVLQRSQCFPGPAAVWKWVKCQASTCLQAHYYHPVIKIGFLNNYLESLQTI